MITMTCLLQESFNDPYQSIIWFHSEYKPLTMQKGHFKCIRGIVLLCSTLHYFGFYKIWMSFVYFWAFIILYNSFIIHNYLYIFRRLHRFIFRNPNNVKQECGSLLKPYDNQHQNLKIEYSQIRLNMYCENFHKNTILKKRIF